MIDDKPCLSAYNVTISSSSMDPVEAKYIVGTIDLSDTNYTKLIDDKSLNFNLSFETYKPKSTLAQKYLVSIPKVFLNQTYIIVNIYNKDNKTFKKRYLGSDKHKKEYYVVLVSPDFSKFD